METLLSNGESAAPIEPWTDWNGDPIRVVHSGGGVMSIVNPSENLMRTGIAPWPPPEIVQKLSGSEHGSAYSDADATAHLSYYTSLQSINSEDAITWSFFGPLVYGAATHREEFLIQLCRLVGIPEPQPGPVHAWLWRKMPHPLKPSAQSGPEIDFGLQSQDLLVVGEAKWKSKVGTGQGPARDSNQIELRRLLCNDFGQRIFPDCQRFLILGVSVTADVVKPYTAACQSGNVLMKDISWADLAALPVPHRDEFERYYRWKLNGGKRP